MRTSMKTLEASSAEPLIPRCLSSLLSLMFPVSPTAPDPTRAQVNDSTRAQVNDPTRVQVNDSTRLQVNDSTRGRVQTSG